MKPTGNKRTRLLRSLPKYFFLILFIPGKPFNTQSQSLNYTFLSSNNGYTPITGTTLFTAHADDELSPPISIGFDFRYADSTYTQIRISTNGYISFNPNAIDSYVNGLATVGGTNLAPLIAPLWDDLEVSNGGSIQYLVSGIAPYRIMTIEWTNMEWNFNAQKGVINFQVRLFESSNNIEFIYKDNGFNVNTGNASVGLAGNNTGSFVSVSDLSPAPIVSAITEVNTVNDKPATGQSFLWQANGIVPLSFLSFTAKKENTRVVLEWICSNTSPNTYFEVLHSTDGIHFTAIGKVNSTAGEKSSYHFTHNETLGNSFYRIRTIDENGRIVFSPVRKITENNFLKITCSNPFTNTLLFSFRQASGQYLIKVYAVNGILVHSQQLNITSQQQDVSVPLSNPKPGTYIITVTPSGHPPPIILKAINR